MLIIMSDLYDPLNLLTFTVEFDSNEKPSSLELAQQVQDYLESLTQTELIDESSKFFQWIVSKRVTTHLDYAESLLAYFHSKGLLLEKKLVQTIAKQSKPRYVVIYDMNGKYFSRVYNSVREIQEDTGKKPTKLCKYQLD